jgi:phosphatidylglycerophosphate synthase
MIPKHILTIPNALSLGRLFGVPLLFFLVYLDQKTWFIGWYLFLGFTDFLDGKLARMWDQTSRLGSHLDSLGDVAYFLATAWFFLCLFPWYLQPNTIWIVLLAVTAGAAILASWYHAGRVTFVHTWLNQANGAFVVAIFVLSFFMDTTYLIRVVLLLLSAGFIEVFLMFYFFGRVHPDTRTILHLQESDS